MYKKPVQVKNKFTDERIKRMKTLEGKLVSDGMKVGIVAARFNEFITSKLVSGAMDGLTRHNVKEEDIQVAWVPGAFEIPLIASKMAKKWKIRCNHLPRSSNQRSNKPL